VLPRPQKYLKRFSPLNRESAKRKLEGRQYRVLREAFLRTYYKCQAKLPGCTHYANDVHHTRGRGKNFLLTETWVATCRHCHRYIHDHPAEAREKNLIFSSSA
jgi:hypothetical protein